MLTRVFDKTAEISWAALRMTLFGLMGCAWCAVASGTTFYVSSSGGSDANSGTSSSAAWQTLAKVNAQALQPGDSVLLRRGDVWKESLIPRSSGTAGNPITFDAYGSGPAPNLTGYYAVPSTSWVLVTGNAWKAPLSATFITVNFCLFGSVWGQKVAVGTSNLNGQWDFYIANGYLYVYSVGSPATYYAGAIVPMALSNVPVIHVNGKSWLTFQHILINWFDQYGVYVSGASDHLVFANMEADSMIPQGAQPLGFYVNESAPGPADLKIYNSEAHLNYDGFRFDGAASAITMVNDKGYANRDAGLVDNTGGAVTYSYCHFYGSSLAVAGSTDVLATTGNGAVSGSGNIPADTAPMVQMWQRYPARVTLTLDDPGMTDGADTYYANTVAPAADAAGVPMGVAITVGYPLAQTLIPTFQSWVNAGRDVTSHSISHTYYTNTDALEIQYTGAGTSATLSISNKMLMITVTGASDSLSFDLTPGQPRGTIAGLEAALTATGHFTAIENPTCQGPYGTGCSYYTKAALLSQDLADVSSVDIKSSVYAMQLDVTRLTTDEITRSRQWMTDHLTGLPATAVYVYPGGYETPTMQGIAAGVYAGARGALKEDLGVKDTYASGFDVQNITSFGVNPSWAGITPASLNQKVQAMVWKQMVWGVPWGIFWHNNELTSTEITNLIADLKNSGATILTNTGLVNWLRTGTLEPGIDGNFYYKSPAASAYTSSGSVDFRPTANSPVVDAGLNLGAAYQIDINGVNQNSNGSGWEIGAHSYIGYSTYGQVNAPPGTHFAVGAQVGGPPLYPASTRSTAVATLPPLPNMGGATGVNTTGYEYSGPSDFYYPSTGKGNCITRLTDANSAGGQSIFTAPSMGGNELLWTTDRVYGLVVTAGGGDKIMHVHYDANGCMVNDTPVFPGPKGNGTDASAGGVTASRVTPARYYHTNPQGNGTVLSQQDVSGTTTITVIDTPIFDWKNCPGVPNRPAVGGGGVLTVSSDDDVFATHLNFGAVSGQNNGHWALAWKRSTNSCASYYTGPVPDAVEAPDRGVGHLNGNIWTWCSGNCSQSGTNPDPIAYNISPCSTATPYYGIHGTQMFKDGTWTNESGALQCTGLADSKIEWEMGTGNLEWCADYKYYCGGHSSVGYSRTFQQEQMADPPNGMTALNYRTHGDIAHFTDFLFWNYYSVPGLDFHGSMQWPGAASDTNPWMLDTMQGNRGDCSSRPHCKELLAARQDGVLVRFINTFDQMLNAQDIAISTMTPDGYCMIFQSDWGASLGLDRDGHQRVDVFSVCNLQ